MREKISGIPGDLVDIAAKEIHQTCIRPEGLSVIFDFESETISFELHYNNLTIPKMSLDFCGKHID